MSVEYFPKYFHIIRLYYYFHITIRTSRIYIITIVVEMLLY